MHTWAHTQNRIRLNLNQEKSAIFLISQIALTTRRKKKNLFFNVFKSTTNRNYSNCRKQQKHKYQTNQNYFHSLVENKSTTLFHQTEMF